MEDFGYIRKGNTDIKPRYFLIKKVPHTKRFVYGMLFLNHFTCGRHFDCFRRLGSMGTVIE
jgi:hypothetical protein